MERLSGAFETLLAALADAVKQLGEGSQQRFARTRVEEAKQDFIACCDVMCFQLKQAVEIIRQEMQQAVTAASPQLGAPWDPEQVRQVLETAERFAAQLAEGPTAGEREGGMLPEGGLDAGAEAGAGAVGYLEGMPAGGPAGAGLLPGGQAVVPPVYGHQQQQHQLQMPYKMEM